MPTYHQSPFLPLGLGFSIRAGADSGIFVSRGFVCFQSLVRQTLPQIGEILGRMQGSRESVLYPALMMTLSDYLVWPAEDSLIAAPCADRADRIGLPWVLKR